MKFQVVREIKTCLECQKEFQSKLVLAEHRKTHHPENLTKCE